MQVEVWSQSSDHDDGFSDDDADDEARREAGGRCSLRQGRCVIGEWVAHLGSRSAVRSERGKDLGHGLHLQRALWAQSFVFRPSCWPLAAY